jgi:hypothetical protein
MDWTYEPEKIESSYFDRLIDFVGKTDTSHQLKTFLWELGYPDRTLYELSFSVGYFIPDRDWMTPSMSDGRQFLEENYYENPVPRLNEWNKEQVLTTDEQEILRDTLIQTCHFDPRYLLTCYTSFTDDLRNLSVLFNLMKQGSTILVTELGVYIDPQDYLSNRENGIWVPE